MQTFLSTKQLAMDKNHGTVDELSDTTQTTNEASVR